MRRLITAYIVSVLTSLLGLAAVMSPYLAANGRLLSGMTKMSLTITLILSLALFWALANKQISNHLIFVLHGITAAVLLPGLIIFSPLLFCIFIGHGACS
jgi:hypothetical protein